MNYEFPYDPDRQVLNAVRVRSRLKRWEGDYLELRENFTAAPVKGSPWEGKVRIENKSLIDDRKAAQFFAALDGTLTLSQFQELVLERKPLSLDVALFPDIQMPAPGVPVPVFAPPVTQQAQIALPKVPAGRIEVLVETVTAPEPGTYVRARVCLPGFVAAEDAEAQAIRRSIEIAGKSSAMTRARVQDQGDYRSAFFVPASGISYQTIAGGTYPVLITAQVAGIELRQEVLISFKMQRNLVLQLSTKSVTVTEKKPASFTASVWEIGDDGTTRAVADAALTASAGDGAAGVLNLSPRSGKSSLSCTASLKSKDCAQGGRDHRGGNRRHHQHERTDRSCIPRRSARG